jgi:CHAT domain-containing protein/predicted negative regulator of RcsB-dependent stress response
MPRSCLKSAAKRGSALFPVVVCLAIGSGVTCAQTVGLPTAHSRGSLALAQRTLADADKLRTEWKSESFRLAARKYARAQRLFHIAGESSLEIETLEKLGDVSALLSDYQNAIVHYSEALPLALPLKDERSEAVVLTKLGSAYLEIANVKKAVPHCSRALDISERLAFDEGTALALDCLGVASSIGGDVLQAQDQFERALAIAIRIKVPRVLALTNLNLGYLHSDLGNMELALSSYKAALAIWQETNEQQQRAATLTAMAGVYNQQGEKSTALDLHGQALKIFRTIGHRNGEAATLNGIGYLYDTLGDRSQSLKCFTRAFELYAAIENQHYAAVTSAYIGRVHLALGDNERALESFNRKLSISRVVQDRRMESYALRDIGSVLTEKGQTKEALARYRQALSLSQDVKDRRGAALILVAIGKLAEKLGDKAEALANYEQALSLMQAVADRRGEVQTLMDLASAKRDLGRLDDARRDIESSLRLIENLRTKISSPALRMSYLETVYRHYEFYVDLLMRKNERDPSGGFATLALEVNEHARARTLLENLIAARTDIRQGVDPQLLEEERQIQQRLNEKAEQQTRLLSSRTQPEREAAIQQEIESLLSQYKEVESRVRDQSPKYAALTQPRPLNLASIQLELDEDTVLLEYALGSARSYAWAVTRHSIESFNLPPRAEINRSAKVVYDTLSQPAASTPVDNYRAAENELSKILLDPVAHLLPGKRLVIVADGILQYIPFTALPDPAVKEGGLRVPLVVKHEIVTLPSISTLAVLRNELRGRMVAGKTLAVIADPVFEKDDPRVRLSRLQGRTQVARSVVALRGSEMDQPLLQVKLDNKPLIFERLPFSLEEAQAILDLARGQKIMRAVGFDANLKAALDPAIGDYRIIHFATHALLNNSHPELSGIVLSLVDQTGRTQDGFLRLNEIYNLNLAADLVVLSACQTALGKESRGEGLIGLTRGFMYAGVPRIVATLWRITDRTTAEFMRYFYEALLNQGESPSKALRTAQIRMWEINKSAIPHYWSAFTLQGEWR